MLEVTKPKEITPFSSSKLSPIRPCEAKHKQAQAEEDEDEEAPHHGSKSSSRKSKRKKSSSTEVSKEQPKEQSEDGRKDKKSSTFSDSFGRWLDDEEKRRKASSLQKILNGQEPRLTMLLSGGQSLSKKEYKSSTPLEGSNGSPDDEKRMMLIGSDEYACAPLASAVTRMVAASAANRGEMKDIIESIRRDRKEYIRERSSNNLEEIVHRVDEQRKALLVKWQAMSEQRKA